MVSIYLNALDWIPGAYCLLNELFCKHIFNTYLAYSLEFIVRI